jgi:hypothetical protein
MGSGEDDSEDVGVRRTKDHSPASVLIVNTPLSPPQRPLRASLRASAAILESHISTGLEALKIDPRWPLSAVGVFSSDADHLVPVILLEYDGCLGEDGAQATGGIIV